MAKKNALDFLSDTKQPEEPKVKVEEVNKDESDKKLNEAAELILSQLTPAIREFAWEVADVVLKIQRWQLVCGSLLAQFESGCLQAPSIDPSWHREGTEFGYRICKYCGNNFVPFKAFQETCDNICGLAYQKQQRELKNESTSTAVSQS